MMTLLTTPFDMILEILANAIRQDKAIQSVRIDKKKMGYS